MRLSLLVPLFLSLISGIAAHSSTGNSVLVVLEPALEKDDYSTFFGNLERRGYELTFRRPDEATPDVVSYDVPQFAHIILFTPTTKTPSRDLSPQSLVQLVISNPATNLLVVLSQTTSPLSTLAAEFGISVPPPNTPLISHFPARPTPHTIIPVPIPENVHQLLTPKISPILFEGISFALNDNPLLFPILNAPVESFCADSVDDKGADSTVEAAEKGGEGLWAGSKMALVSGFQAKNGARATFVGGVKVFSNEFAEAKAFDKRSGNAQLVSDIAAWTFQESLVLKVDSASHYLASDSTHTQKDQYTTNDELVFDLNVSKYNPSSNKYEPYSGIQDMQLEFTMLDPHIRTSLKPVAGTPGRYSLQFRAPDRHGVFKFVVNYKRKGYTAVEVSLPVAIVPPRHDGYPRFLSSAWPYYAGSFSTSIGFILFCIVYLGGESRERRKGKAKAE